MRRFLLKWLHWFQYHFIPWFTSLGVTKGTITLEIAGRKSGKITRTSLTMVRQDGARYFVSLFGESQWVKNLRAAGGKATLVSGKRTPVQFVEIPEEERAPILLKYVNQRAFSHSGAESARIFFGLDPNPTLAQMETLAHKYSVFRIDDLH